MDVQKRKKGGQSVKGAAPGSKNTALRGSKHKRSDMVVPTTGGRRAFKVRRNAVPGVARLAISFDPSLATKVHDSADAHTAGNVSAWLAQAAEQRLRVEALDAAVKWLEEKNGPSTKDDLERVEQLWPRD